MFALDPGLSLPLPRTARQGRPRRLVTAAVGALAGALCVVVVTGCPARRAGLPRESLESTWTEHPAQDLPTLPELLRLRVPVPAARPAQVEGTAAHVAFADGEEVPVGGANGVDADAFRCLRADAVRDYARVVERCVGFAEAHATDVRALVALQIAARHLGALPDDDRRAILRRAPGLVSACARARAETGSCAELAVVVDDVVRAAAERLGDRAALRAASPGGDLTSASAEGPFLAGDEAFAGSPFASKPLVKGQRFRVVDVNSADGVLSPARRGPSGWWRLSLRGEALRAARGLLLVRASGPVEVRLDGTPVVVRPHGADVRDIERVGVQVEAGVHALEVLVRDVGGGVRLSAFADDGTPLFVAVPKQKWSKTATSSVVDVAGVVGALPLPPDADRGDTTALVNALFRHAFARAGLGQSADDERVHARLLLSRFGWSPPALVAAADTVDDDALPDRVADALAQPLWSAVLARWPTHPVALLSRARVARDERPDDALKLYRALVAANPTYPTGRREFIAALLDRGVVDEARVNADALLALGATNENIDAALPALRATGALTLAAQLADERARRSLGDDGWRRRLAAGDTEAVRRDLQARAVDDEKLVAPWLELDEVADPAGALRALDGFIAQSPDALDLHIRRARLLAHLQGPEAAARALDELDVWDERIVKLREAWGGASPVGDHRERGDRAIAERRAATTEPFPGFPAVFLLDHLERRFAGDGSSLVVRHWVAELRAKSAIDAFGELRVGDREQLVRLRVVKPDGTTREPEHHGGVDDVSLPSLAAGDIVEWLSWSIDNTARDGAFWETVSMRRAQPIVERSYVVEVPRATLDTRQVRILAENGAAPPAETAGGTAARPTLRLTAIARPSPALLGEPESVEDLEAEPQVGITIDLDDHFFRRQRARAFLDNTRVDPWLVDAARAIAGRGRESERLDRLFSFVAERITEADAPADAVSVLVVGRGARLPLFHALARAAGFDARAIGVHPPLAVERRIPSVGAFPITLTSVVADDEPHLALFGASAALDKHLSAMKGAETLDLEDGTTGVFPERFIDTSPVELRLDLEVVGTGEGRRLKGVAALRLPVFLAGVARPSLRQLTPDRLVKLMEAGLADSLPGVKVGQVTTPGLSVDGRPFGVIADIEVPIASETVRFEHLFALGAAAPFQFARPLSSLVRIADRQRALRVLPHEERLEVTLRLPEHASFVEVPGAAALDAGPVSLRQRSSVHDGKLVWERTLTLQGQRVPTSSWPAMRAALSPVLSQADARIAFVLAPRP